MSKLYGIGVGPGDSELLTLKAVRAIGESQVIVAPSSEEEGDSIAYETTKEFIKEGTEVIIAHFPMGKKNTDGKVLEAYEIIKNRLQEGKIVSFLTIGDPLVYSTYVHLLRYIQESGFKVETVPGITSFCASAALTGRPVVMGNEPLLVLPARRINDITDEKYVVVMKVYKREKEVLDLLEEKGFNYVMVRKAGREGQVITSSREEILSECEYMSLIIANR